MESVFKRTFGIIDKNILKQRFRVSKIYNINIEAVGVLSTSLYGDDTDHKIYDRYVRPLLYNINIMKKHLPLWVYRVYLDPRMSEKTRRDIINTGCEVHLMNKISKGHEGSHWRFLVASGNKPYIILDSDDDILTNQNKYSNNYWVDHIEKWLKSDKTFFQDRTNMYNISFMPITAKYWGGKANSIPEIEDYVMKYSQSWYGNDEAMLTKKIYPLFKKYGLYAMPYNNYELVFICGIFILFVISIRIKLLRYIFIPIFIHLLIVYLFRLFI